MKPKLVLIEKYQFGNVGNMDAKTFIKKYGRKHAARVAEAAGTSFQYLYNISIGYRTPSRALAARLEQASGGVLTRIELLYPDENTGENTHV